MTVALRPITKENWFPATKLKVKPEQESFVAPNVFSIAQFQFFPELQAQGIYADEELVGFVMWGEDADENPGEIWIWRLMIDAAHQSKGHGKAAMQLIIMEARAAGHDALYLSYAPDNTGAAAFYAKLGFQDTGRVEHGETVVRLALGSE